MSEQEVIKPKLLIHVRSKWEPLSVSRQLLTRQRKIRNNKGRSEVQKTVRGSMSYKTSYKTKARNYSLRL